jgi:hypothetical protein
MAPLRIAQGSKVVKSSKIGEINLGYASQKFSGGGTTQMNQGQEGGIGILGGYEFGSNKYRSIFLIGQAAILKAVAVLRVGLFIRLSPKNQPYLIAQWEKSFDQIIKEWT